LIGAAGRRIDAAEAQATCSIDSEVSPLVPKPEADAEGVTVSRGCAGKGT